MDIIKFRPYKNVNDDRLIWKINNNMKILRKLSEKDNEGYNEKKFLLNDMIIEAKKRKIKLDDKTFMKNILM
ncbi:hypothetical protein [Dethiothermospora halolimnae]|uniref:hypothetical protein n=1 Tax=Dethiothermospora halolimnae TaxID=3114390 RepID=UPI003CCB9FFB